MSSRRAPAVSIFGGSYEYYKLQLSAVYSLDSDMVAAGRRLHHLCRPQRAAGERIDLRRLAPILIDGYRVAQFAAAIGWRRSSWRPRAHQNMFRRFALDGEIGVVSPPASGSVSQRQIRTPLIAGRSRTASQSASTSACSAGSGAAARSSALSHGFAAAPCAERKPISPTTMDFPVRAASASRRSAIAHHR